MVNSRSSFVTKPMDPSSTKWHFFFWKNENKGSGLEGQRQNRALYCYPISAIPVNAITNTRTLFCNEEVLSWTGIADVLQA